MIRPLGTRARRAALTGTIIGLSMVAIGFFAFRRPPDLREFWSVEAAWRDAGAKPDAPTKERIAGRGLEIARKYPGTVGGLSTLFLGASLGPDTSAGRDVREELARSIETADVGVIADALDRTPLRWESLSGLAPALLARVRRSADHPRAGRFLAAVCAATEPGEGEDPPPIFTDAADLIADRYSGSPDIGHFCESLGVFPFDGHPWSIRYERHLQAILASNRDRSVRCRALMALAIAIQSAPGGRQAEAQELYEQFCKDFDGKEQYPFQGIERMLIDQAQGQLKELRSRAVGMPAPEIAGSDLDERPISLSAYRGRVVLLNFWATWCYPCMKLIPHERDLATRFTGRPFEIVGVNCDEDLAKARDAIVKNRMIWRSFRNQAGRTRAIASEWNVIGYPTLYLIDHNGIIRKRWIGGPTPEELASTTGVLVDAAERKLSPDAIHSLLAVTPDSMAQKPAPAVFPSTTSPRPSIGFREKVYRDADGTESKYAVFVPRSYDGTKSVPAILYLHGAGKRGSDGRSHLDTGLAKAIQQRSEDFPFLAIFPQAREDEDWKAESVGGNRALAILKRVQSEFRVDANRVALTGISMGGQGMMSQAQWKVAVATPA